MKKLKILPSLLMLVLCFGVLAVGIYALTPTQNAISGTITINAANSPVKIETYLGTTKQETFETVREGETLTFGTLEFFDTPEEEANAGILDAKEIRLSIKVTNKGTSPLGAFFAESTTTFADGELADGDDDVIYKKQYKEGDLVIAQAYMSSYTPISAGDTEEMAISITLQNFPTTSSQNFDLGLKLFIEPYEATDEDLWGGIYGEEPEDFRLLSLIKIAEGVEEVNSVADVALDSSVILALPRSVTEYVTDENYMPGMMNIPNNNDVDFPSSSFNDITDAVFVPSNAMILGFDAIFTYENAVAKFFVSYDNQNQSNDNQYAVYNKDKTQLYTCRGDNYVAPSTLTTLGQGVGAIGGTYDFSACKDLRVIDVSCLLGAGQYKDLDVILPNNLTAFNCSKDLDPWHEGYIPNFTFTGITPPIFGDLTNIDGVFKIRVPKGYADEYTTALNVNNATLLTAGKITIIEY